MENKKTNDGRILVVSMKETDPSCTLCKEPYCIEVVGLFHDMASATAEVNKHLVRRKKDLEAYYEAIIRRTEKEISDMIAEISANRENPGEQEILRESISVLVGLEKAYRAAMVPETLIENDDEGDLCEVTSRDERINWTVTFEIEKMTVKPCKDEKTDENDS